MTEPLDAARFAEPEVGDRPGVRWWWQGEALVDDLLDQLHAIADAGFGEVEIAFNREFWADAAQRTTLTAVLKESERLGVGVAMTLGASWPLRTPNTAIGTPFSSRELQYGSARLPGTGLSHVQVPAAFDDPQAKRPASLVRVTAARVLERSEPPSLVGVEDEKTSPRGSIRPPATSTVLDSTSLIDLTSEVIGSEARTIRWQPRDGDWMLFAFWMRECDQGSRTFLDEDATAAATAYIEKHQLGTDNVELLRSVGTDFFEDSLELDADSLFWTADLLERFTERHGYDPTPYLPLLFAHGMSHFWVPNEESTADFELDTGLGHRVRQDYYRLLTDLYISRRLLPLQEWSAAHGMRHKAQAAYGQNLEAIRSNRAFVRAGGRAEGESLNSGDRFPVTRSDATWRFALDWQRCVVGGAHQGGAVRVSTELGAQFRAAYAVTLGDLQRMLAKEWAAGITKPFVHGVASQGPDAEWPTQTRFQHIVSDSWNSIHFPEWANWRPLTDYWARGTAVLETGVPRTDIAIHRDGFLTTAARGVRDATADATAPIRLADTEALELSGFSVQFIDPLGVVEGIDDSPVLFSDGPGYRGLVIDERMLPPETAEAIAEAAGRGVRVVFVGELPSGDSGLGHRADGDARVRSAVRRALSMSTTARVQSMAETSTAFLDLGLVPRVRTEGGAVLTQWREAGDIRYLFVYNTQDTPVRARLSLEGVGRVRELDLWTGLINPYPHAADGDRTALIAGIPPSGIRVFELATGVRPDSAADVSDPADVPSNEAAGLLESWRLDVVSEEPGGPRSIRLDGVGPGDWRTIDALRGVSGIGRYTARLGLPSDTPAGSDVSVHLGALAGSAVIRLDGRIVGVAYLDDTVIRLGGSVADGSEIEIEVRTSIRNAVVHSGIDVFDDDPLRPHGLLGPVTLSIQHPQSCAPQEGHAS